MKRWIVIGLVLLSTVAWAEEILRSAAEVIKSDLQPTGVCVDKAGRFYLLHRQSAYMDIYSPQGKFIQRRGGQAKQQASVGELEVVSNWVGRNAASMILAREVARNYVIYLMRPDKDEKKLEILKLTGATDLTGQLTLARDLEGRIFIYHREDHTIYGFGGSTGELKYQRALAGSGRKVYQMALDSKNRYYLLGSNSLDVFDKDGSLSFTVPEAQCFYLTGADRMATADRLKIRKYDHDGSLLSEWDTPPEGRGKDPVAISLNDQGDVFVYYRDPTEADGTIVKLKHNGEFLAAFPQPKRYAPQPDPGYRLDFRGRLHCWLPSLKRLVRVHPGGKLERSLRYYSGTDDKGYMNQPRSIRCGPDQTVWIADSGNYRLQRFNINQGGWQDPIPVSIKGGAPQAEPVDLAVTPDGGLMVVASPPDQRGLVVLQRRDREGKLISQRDLGAAEGEPVYKVAVAPNGEVFIYRSQGPGGRPQLERYTARGQLMLTVGGEDRNFHLPGQFTSQVNLSPNAELIPHNGGLLIPFNGQLLWLNSDLKIAKVQRLIPARDRVTPEYEGGSIVEGKLYLTDRANLLLHKFLLK